MVQLLVRNDLTYPVNISKHFVLDYHVHYERRAYVRMYVCMYVCTAKHYIFAAS